MRALVLALALLLAMPAHADTPVGAVLSDADHATLTRIEAYLNTLTALKARFTQIGVDGGTATGTAWLVRPGRMRFEYDPPSPLLLVAGHGLVVFRDNKLDQTTNIPEGQTPLGLLLGKRISLSDGVTVTDFRHTPGLYQVTLVRTASPGDGTLTLYLDDRSMALGGWAVVDAQGRETRIKLTEITLGGDYPEKLFTFIDPHFFQGGGGDTP